MSDRKDLNNSWSDILCKDSGRNPPKIPKQEVYKRSGVRCPKCEGKYRTYAQGKKIIRTCFCDTDVRGGLALLNN